VGEGGRGGGGEGERGRGGNGGSFPKQGLIIEPTQNRL